MVGKVTMHATLDAIRVAKIMPVIVIDDAAAAPDVIAALQAGGIHCGEITLRTSAGVAAIAAASGISGFTLGAGTVLTTADVDACVDAGSQFIVCPGLDRTVVEYALSLGIAALPGVATATEIQVALSIGLNVVKLFPADRLGGLDAVRSFAGPFPDLQFVPSGGVGLHNVSEYLAHPSIFAISGSWMAPRSAIAAGDFEGIQRLSAEALALT
jgi:2-dehydro-3-deoxyphosphogluconate aldolase / (4S)-4-hydroxy-2-oxoglutarate aldolase